ncbi:polysaccharide deacetylase family protein [Slackia sp.]|uniref:polysaccharide deacetylase family protein n=1 Tax=Slackia sp. TaxID=2049041 RepID=UPI00399B7018
MSTEHGAKPHPTHRQESNTAQTGSRHGRPSVSQSRRVRGSQPRKATPTPKSPEHEFDVNSTTHNHAAEQTPAQRFGQPEDKKHAPNTPSQGYQPLWDERPFLNPRISRRLFIAAGATALVAVGVFGFSAFKRMMPITVSVNGSALEIKGERTLQAVLDENGTSITPGNLVDITGEIVTQGGGTPFTATINGQEATDPSAALADGDVLTLFDGADIEEPSRTKDKTIGPNAVELGNGPIHAITAQGAQSLAVVKTGETSGKEVIVETKEEGEDRIYQRAYPDTGGEKVVALTFDDGPWENHTAAILDILRDNGAKATFFTVGERIAGPGVDLVKRESDEGHQVCTHSWDHASGSGQGVNLSFMSRDEQRDEIVRGMQAIADATGKDASKVIRAPGGNFPLEVWQNLEDIIVADIGWDIDTLDWKRPGTSAVADQLKSATPGDIILMHDGGGDRSQTVEALRIALPYLKEQGFSFVTIDEIMKYPVKEE